MARHVASGPHPLSPQVSGVASSGVFGDASDAEELTLLPHAEPRSVPGGSYSRSHKHSFSASLDTQWHTFQVAMFKPAPKPEQLLTGGSRKGEAGVDAGTFDGGTSDSSQSTEAPLFATLIEDLQPSQDTKEWLLVGLTLLPKISWGWLPFCFNFLGFSLALKLLLFITLFSVYSAAILYRLYLHSDKRGQTSLADFGEAAFGKRLGRRPVVALTRTIDVALPCVLHVAGTRFLQTWLFYTTGVCLPWISLLFGGIVLGLAQIQRLGGHPALVRIVQPALTGAAVATTLLKLLLLQAQQARVPAVAVEEAQTASLPYMSDYVIAVVQLISANYMGQHFFMEEMSGMSSPSCFQHSCAWAQVITLLTNMAVAIATLRVQPLHPHGFISMAFGPDLLSRFLNLLMWVLMTVKYVIVLHSSTRRLLPRLPHLLVNCFEDPDGVDSNLHIKPRQLWLICSSIVVVISFLVSNTFPHTFLYLSGLLVSLCYIPIAYTLPCLFSLKLLSNQITALEYTLSTWVVPVSVIMSLMGCWASIYHIFLKWSSADHDGSWGCNLLQH